MADSKQEGSTISGRLRQAMEAKRRRNGARVTVQQIADAAGVARASASLWLNNPGPEGPKRAALEKVAAFLGVSAGWLEHGDEPVQQAVSQAMSHDLPHELRVAAKRFELEATELGADDQALAYIRHSLTSPEAVVLYHGGYREQVSIDAMRQRQESMMRGLRLWLDEYLQMSAPRLGPSIIQTNDDEVFDEPTVPEKTEIAPKGRGRSA